MSKRTMEEIVNTSKHRTGDPHAQVFMGSQDKTVKSKTGSTIITSDGTEIKSPEKKKTEPTKQIDPREMPEVKEIIDFNLNVVGNSDNDLNNMYTNDLVIRQGRVLIQLFKKIPIKKLGNLELFSPSKAYRKNNAGTGFTTHDDPYPYMDVGVVINVDPMTFANIPEDKKEYVLEKGDVVTIPAQSVVTDMTTEKTPYIQDMFLYGNELENYQGHVLKRTSDIILKITNFKVPV